MEDDVYDEMDESAYADHVAKRREENFIEDDEGKGDYVDFGQDDFDDEAYSGDEGEGVKRAKKPGDKGRGLFNNLAPRAKKKATERVNGMFLGAGREVRPPPLCRRACAARCHRPIPPAPPHALRRSHGSHASPPAPPRPLPPRATAAAASRPCEPSPPSASPPPPPPSTTLARPPPTLASTPLASLPLRTAASPPSRPSRLGGAL